MLPAMFAGWFEHLVATYFETRAGQLYPHFATLPRIAPGIACLVHSVLMAACAVARSVADSVLVT